MERAGIATGIFCLHYRRYKVLLIKKITQTAVINIVFKRIFMRT